jgi:hypothetical protein
MVKDYRSMWMRGLLRKCEEKARCPTCGPVSEQDVSLHFAPPDFETEVASCRECGKHVTLPKSVRDELAANPTKEAEMSTPRVDLANKHHDVYKIEVFCSQQGHEELSPLLKALRALGSMGCSRDVIIKDSPLETDSFSFDGDGASKIYDIVHSKSVKTANPNGCPKCGKEFDFEDHYCGPAKTADIDPNIRASVDDAKPNGLDVQQPLLRNPYSAGTAGDPHAAMEFENGYQFAQSMGHQQLNQVQPQQAQSWATRSKPWRDGFAQAARGMGCGNVAAQLDASNKIAQHRTSLMLPNFPISVNFKIASALGTVMGGLGGAALGSAAGHLAAEASQGAPYDPNGSGHPTQEEIPVHGHIPDFAAQRGWDTLTPAGHATPAELSAAHDAVPQHEYGHADGGPTTLNFKGLWQPSLMDKGLDSSLSAISGHPAEAAGAGAGALLGGVAGGAIGGQQRPKLAMSYFAKIAKKSI